MASKEFPQLRQKGEYYYFDTLGKPRRWIPLGKNWDAVIVEYRKLAAEKPAAEKARYATVADMLDVYMQYLKHGGSGPKGGRVTASTQATYGCYVRSINAVFSAADPRDLTQKDIDRYMYECKRTTFAHERSLLSSAYQHAFRTSDISFNPCLGVRIKRKVSRRDRLLTDAEVTAIRDQLSPMMKAAADLAYMLALRPVDLRQLRREQFVEAGADVLTQKTQKLIRYVVNDELREVLAEAAEARWTYGNFITPYVLINTRGRPFTKDMLEYYWDKARTAVGLKDTQFRDLRAKAASDLELQKNDGGVSAQKMLGHTSLLTTRVYLRNRSPNVVVPMRRKNG